MISIYIDNFLLTSSTMTILENFKKRLSRMYDIEDLREVKTIISQQVTRDPGIRIQKIYQSVYRKDLLEKENLTNCNVPTISMKVGSAIKMNESDNYDDANLAMYQCLIDTLIYFVYGKRLDITIAVRRLSKHNADLYKRYLRPAKHVIQSFKRMIYLELLYK